jgi:hypothetical protein
MTKQDKSSLPAYMNSDMMIWEGGCYLKNGGSYVEFGYPFGQQA